MPYSKAISAAACVLAVCGVTLQAATAQTAGRTAGYNVDRNAYFGDLHVHTRLSFDAYIFNVRASPEDAYRYARGESINHALGYDIRLTDAPLDFLAVTDHSEYLGVLQAMDDPQHPLSKVPYAHELLTTDVQKIPAAFQRIVRSLREAKYLPEMRDPETRGAAWRSIIEAAERNYIPGRFTTFIGYEYTSAPQGKNLHRNVVFASSRVPDLPFSALESPNPENLWSWMDDLRRQGIDALAIPHNSNGSDGAMFAMTTFAGKPFDRAYADRRVRNEPLVEITQVKGTSDTHPLLSPNDEWGNFEIMPTYIGSATQVTIFDGGYVRRALQRGLQTEANIGVNPYQVGLIGSSDTHNAGGPIEEDRFFGKIGLPDGAPERRGSIPDKARTWEGYEPSATAARYATWGAAGLAGVWAEENTRESIFAALSRKETFATTGPRMRVRFFAGFDFPDDMLSRDDLVRIAYRRGTPMGGTLLAKAGEIPQFLIWALRDPHAGWLQRVQIIKGWMEGGEPRERVFDIACSDGLKVDPATHRCPDNGASVDPATCAVSRNKGAVELQTLWADPTYDPKARAFYYVRVLENPTCRWSTWDALRAGVPPNPKLPRFIQERAWSSPIWVSPRT